MVSTRQMATNCGSGLLNQNCATSDSARLNTMSTQTQRGMIAAPSMPTRQCGHHQSIQQNQQQQLVKENDTTATAAANENTVTVQLLDMPVEVLSKIFAYVGYRKVGQMRVISSRMNDVCMDILNSTFSRLITQTYNRFHAIKANMPRRESARRNHPLACECDIIETCYMRLSLLQMTFGKHIERGHCCFFPGAILDEVYNILTYIRNTPRLERPYRVTDELFDLSTMAMEYFRDRIEQTLPDIAYFNKDFFKLPTTTKRPALVASVDHADSASTSPPQSNMVLRKGIRKIKQGMKIYNNQLSVLRNELRNCKRKSSEQGKQIAEQQKLLAEQQKQTLEYANRLDENDKKNEEIARKFSTLLQELNKCKTELQYWRSKSPAIPICTSCGQKLAPSLPPPEDFQALVNQGVKPEDIILNLRDTDTDIGKLVSNSGSGALTAITTQSSQAGSVFAFPDKDTTAKLLAVSSTVNKNQLKRQHFSASSTSANLPTASNDGHSAFNIYASGSSSSSNNGNNTNCCSCHLNPAAGTYSNATTRNENFKEFSNAIDADDCRMSAVAQSLPSEMTNRLNYVRGSNIIRTTATAANNSNNNWYGLQQNNPTTTISKTIGGNAISAEQTGEPAATVSFGGKDTASSIKLPQTVGGRSHRSVIVSPAMLSATKGGNCNGASHMSMPLSAKGDSDIYVDNSSDATPSLSVSKDGGSGGVGVGGIGGVGDGEDLSVEHVVSLQAITSHDTKKARRVQKATRCLNGSGKRSK
uniref:F-box only protein 28 n=1 Tax=Bactrocera latifrons TaxID=174628 RepID=A0A0K8V3I2_BACLA